MDDINILCVPLIDQVGDYLQAIETERCSLAFPATENPPHLLGATCVFNLHVPLLPYSDS